MINEEFRRTLSQAKQIIYLIFNRSVEWQKHEICYLVRLPPKKEELYVYCHSLNKTSKQQSSKFQVDEVALCNILIVY